jgi:mono/diheme cytochrome c family protein
MRRIALLTAVAVLAASGMAVAQQATRTAIRTGPTAPELAHGREVFAHWCAPCHAVGPRLAGTMSLQTKYEGRVPAALEDRTDLTVPVIGVFVRNGVAWMPPFRPTEISDEDLAALSAYLTAPLPQRGTHAPLLADEMMQRRTAQ